MSANIDERIVKMTFDNKNFEQNVKTTLSSLDELDKSTKSLTSTASKVDFSGMTKGTDNIKVKWSGLTTVVDQLNRRLANWAIDGVRDILKFINPLDNLANGFKKVLNIIESKGWTRAANLENAQFQLEGMGIVWDKVSNQINAAVEGTAYGLDSAAKAASQLAASGVRIGEGFKFGKVVGEDVDEMERALGAISGIAAMTNSQYDDIAEIFTSAAGKGKVQAMEFNRIAQRGLNAAATLAKAMGTTEEHVRDLASKGKISFQQFADAMYDAYYEQAKKSNETFDGALANMQAALGRIGAMFATPLRKAAIEPFNELRMLINRIKTELGPVAGYFENFINELSKGFSAFIRGIDSDKLKFVRNIGDSLVNICRALMSVILPLKDAIQALFPGSFFDYLNNLTDRFKKWTNSLILTNREMNEVKRIFYSVGIVLKSIGSIIKQLIGYFGRITIGGEKISTILLKLVATLATGAAYLIYWVDKSQILTKALNALGTAAKIALTAIGGLTALIAGGAVAGFSKLSAFIKEISLNLSTKIGNANSNPLLVLLTKLKETVVNFITGLPEAISHIKDFFKAFMEAETIGDKLNVVLDSVIKFKDKIVETLKGIKDAVIDAFKNSKGGKGASLLGAGDSFGFDFSKLANIATKIKEYVKNIDYGKIATFAFITSLFLMLNQFRKLTKSVTGMVDGFTGISDAVKRLLGSIGGSIGNVASGMKNLLDTIANAQVQKTSINDVADALIKFAGAIGILVGVILVLNHVGLTKVKEAAIVLGEIAIGIIALTGALALLNKIADLGFLTKFSVALVLMSGSVLILASAFNQLDTSGGFGTVFGKIFTLGLIMAELGGMAALLSKAAPSLTKGSIFLIAFALSVKLLGKALNDMPDLTESLSKLSLIAIGVMVAAKYLSKGVTEFGKALLYIGGTILSIAASALLIIAAIKLFNTISPSQIDYAVNNLSMIMGLIGVYAAVMSIVVGRFGKDMPRFGALLISTAASVWILSHVVEALGSLKPEQVNQGVEAISAMLIAFAVLEALSVFTEKAHPVKFAASLILISGCVGLLGGIAAILGLVKPEQIHNGEKVIAALFGLVGALMFVSQYTEKANTKAIIALIVSLGVLFSTMLALSLISDYASIYRAIGTMSAIMISFGVMMASVSKFKYKKGNLLGMIACAAIVAEVAGSLAVLARYNWSSLAAAGVAISITLLTFTKVLETISSRTGLKTNKIATFLAATVALIPIAGALWVIARYDWNSLLGAGAAISATLFIYSELLKRISSSSGLKPDKIATFLAATLAIIPIAAGLALIAGYSWENLAAAGLAVSATLLAFGAALKILSGVKINLTSIGAFLAGTLAMLPIAESISQLAGYDWQNVIISAAAMALAVTAIAGALALVSAAGGGVKSLAGAGSIAIVAAGMFILAEALKRFGEVNIIALEEAGVALAAIVVAITALGLIGPVALIGAAAILVVCAALDLLAVAVIGAATGMALFMPTLTLLSGMDLAGLGSGLVSLAGGLALFAAACLVLQAATLGLAAGALTLPQIAVALRMLSEVGDLTGVAENLAKIGLACTVLGAAGPGMLIAATGMTLMAAAINRLAPAVSKLATTFATAMSLIQTSFNMLSSKMVLQGSQIGVNTAAGMVNGITGNTGKVVQAGVQMATKFVNGIKSFLGIHSPSRIMQAIGRFCGIGFDEGSTDSAIWSGIGQKVKGLLQANLLNPASEAGAKLKSYISNAMNGLTGLTDYTNKFSNLLHGSNYIGQFKNAEDAIKGNNLALDEGKDLLDEYGFSLDGVTDALGGAGGAAAETKSAFEELTDKIAGQMDIFSEFSAKTDLSSDQLLANMKSQIDGVSNWANMMAQLGERGIDEGLLEYLGNLGPQGYEYVNAFVNMTADQLETANGYFQKSLTLPGEAAATIQSSYENAGAMATLGFNNGLKLTEVAAKCKEMGVTGLEALQQSLDMHSPSKKTEQIGTFFMAGFDRGARAGYLTNTIPMLIQIAHGMVEMFQTFLGPESASPIGETFVTSITEAINTGLSEGLATDTTWVTKIIPPEAVTTLQTQAMQLGTGINNGILMGINLTYTLVVERAQELIKSILLVMQMQLGHANGQSQKTKEYGLGICNGLTQGMTNGTYSVLSKARSICQQVISIFSTEINRSKFEQYGRYISEGLAAGMEAGLGKVKAAAEEMIKAAEAAVEAKAKIASPSKLFKSIGKWIPAGLAKGITDNLGLVSGASETMVDKTVNLMSEAIDKISATLDSDMELSPTITPVVDLSEVQNGVADMNSLFSRGVNVSAIKASRANVSRSTVSQASDATSASTGTVNNFTFNQTNNSPKALSRVDIYRQTRNQFSQMKGLVNNA